MSAWNQLMETSEKKKTAAHCERNKDPILEVFQKEINKDPVRILELASGTGQHAAYFSQNLKGNVLWQSSDFDSRCIESINEWIASIPQCSPCKKIDLSKDFDTWDVSPASFDVVFNANTIHIAPYPVLEGLCKGASASLCKGGKFLLYGPMKIQGEFNAESNKSFDQNLRSLDSSWGIRDFEDLDKRLGALDMKFLRKYEMPANNYLFVWEKLK